MEASLIADELQGRAGPGDAPDEEGQSVVFRDEGAYRGGCALGSDTQPGDAAGEHLGCSHCARAVARARGAGGGDAGYQGGKGERDRDTDVDWPVAMKAGKRRGLDKAGASVPVCEAPLRLREGALSGAGEDHAAYRRVARAHQSAHRRAHRHRLTWGRSVRRRAPWRRQAGRSVADHALNRPCFRVNQPQATLEQLPAFTNGCDEPCPLYLLRRFVRGEVTL